MFDFTIWADEQTEHPYRFRETVNEDGTVDHQPAHGQTLVEGTPQNADHFGKMEHGIMDAHVAAAIFQQYAMHSVKEKLEDHEDEFAAETGTVVLTNTNTGFFAFNNSGQTVALQKVRKTLNYDLEIVVESYTGGQLGNVIVYDKQLNGFKLKFEGSASNATIKYKVRGGMIA